MPKTSGWFQIVDDILDITATQENWQKQLGRFASAKSNLSQSGGGKSQRQAQQLIEAASEELATFGERRPLGDRGLHYQPHSLKPVRWAAVVGCSLRRQATTRTREGERKQLAYHHNQC